MAAIRRTDITLARRDPQAIGPHHACHTLMIDEVAPTVKLMRHAAVSIAVQLILDVLDERNKSRIAKVPSPSRPWAGDDGGFLVADVDRLARRFF